MQEYDDQPPSSRWIRCPIEEEYLGQNRKEGKMRRKIASAKDRSKYKKTDQAKYLKSIEKDKKAKLNKQIWLEGRVLTIMPQGIMVDWQGEIVSCVLKGLLKKEKTHAKNLVAVGDFVLFEKTADGEGIIGHIKPRQTILSRADNLSRRKEQLIAVNIDQVIITVSVVHPPKSRGISCVVVVVCTPFLVFSTISPTRKSKPVITLIKEDFPTPDCPEKTEVLSCMTRLRSSIPVPCVALIAMRGTWAVAYAFTASTYNAFSFSKKLES